MPAAPEYIVLDAVEGRIYAPRLACSVRGIRGVVGRSVVTGPGFSAEVPGSPEQIIAAWSGAPQPAPSSTEPAPRPSGLIVPP